MNKTVGQTNRKRKLWDKLSGNASVLNVLSPQILVWKLVPDKNGLNKNWFSQDLLKLKG